MFLSCYHDSIKTFLLQYLLYSIKFDHTMLYHRQQNTLYPKSRHILRKEFLALFMTHAYSLFESED